MLNILKIANITADIPALKTAGENPASIIYIIINNITIKFVANFP